MGSKDFKTQAKEEGWNVNDSYIKEKFANLSYKNCLETLLNADQKQWGLPVPSQDTKGKCKNLLAPLVLQISAIANISAPKANEDSNVAPQLLKLTFTDGKNSWNGLIISPIKSVTLKTHPGSKIKLTSNVVANGGYFLLTSRNIQFLGGYVEEIYDKWKLYQSVSKYKRTVTLNDGSGPPPWVPFGKAIVVNKENNFKALANKREDEDITVQRKLAVQDITGGESNKKFGGGKQMLDTNVQRIINAGFSLEDAEWALKKTRNDPNKALQQLRGVTTTSNKDPGHDFQSRENRRGKRRGKFGKKGRDFYDSDEESDFALANAPRPSGPASLVDYLQDKIPSKTTTSNASSTINTKKSFHNENRLSQQSNFHSDKRSVFRDEDPVASNFWPSLGQDSAEINEEKGYQNKREFYTGNSSNHSRMSHGTETHSRQTIDNQRYNHQTYHSRSYGDNYSKQRSYNGRQEQSVVHSNSSYQTSTRLNRDLNNKEKELIASFERSMALAGYDDYGNNYRNRLSHTTSNDENSGYYYDRSYNSQNYRSRGGSRGRNFRGRGGYNRY